MIFLSIGIGNVQELYLDLMQVETSIEFPPTRGRRGVEDKKAAYALR